MSGALLVLLAWGSAADARTHQATIGNYYYEDDQQQDRTKITVQQGDQITFTVRDAAYPPHTVDVDALNIHSPDLLVGQTFTTPRLNRTGNFYLYCRPHEQRGHHTRLVVVAAAAQTLPSEPASTPEATNGSKVVGVATPAPSVSAHVTPSASPRSTLTPVGIGTAPPGAADHPIRRNPHSLEALTGRKPSNAVPWTRSLWWLLIATVPIVGAAVFALRRDAILQAAAADAAAARAKLKAPAKRKPRGPRKR